MDLTLLARGLVIGFSIAAPVGPIGVLCIRRTLQNGFRSGLASGLGAATADAVYGMIAAAGLTEIDYVEVVDTESLKPLPVIDRTARICLAVRIGACRLIDNVGVDPPEHTG